MINCESCGTEYEDFATYCNECDKPLVSDAGEDLELKRVADSVKGIEGAIKTAVIIHRIMFWLYLLSFTTIVIFIVTLSLNAWVMYIVALIPLAIGLFHLKIARGLIGKQKWARRVSIGIGIILLFGFPVGTIVGFILLNCTLRKGWEAEPQ